MSLSSRGQRGEEWVRVGGWRGEDTMNEFICCCSVTSPNKSWDKDAVSALITSTSSFIDYNRTP